MQLLCTGLAFAFSLIEMLLYLCGFACLLQNEKTAASSAPKVGVQHPPPKVNEVLGHFVLDLLFR